MTRLQSASNSSARIMGTLVRTPCPISERCATIVTVPVLSMDTNTLGLSTPTGVSAPSAASALPMPTYFP